MRKILCLISVVIYTGIFSQGKIHIFNYTQYNLYNALVGSDAGNNCYPSVNGTNHPVPVPPGGAVTYDGYYLSGNKVPPINQWTVYFAGGGVSMQQHSAPVLINLGLTTTWQMNKFTADDVNGNSIPYSGNSIGTIACGTAVVDYVGPTPGYPIPYEAFWFTAGGETYFVIQP